MPVTFPLVPNRIKNVVPEFDTNVVVFENKKEQRSPNYDVAKERFKLVFQLLNKADTNTLIDFFKARKGQFEAFLLNNHIDGQTYTVRFASDKLSLNYLNVHYADCEIEVVTC